jgi:hypothetical protein
MEWKKPTVEVIDMNAEIGGYQPDFDDERDERPVAEREAQREEPKDGG